MEIFKKPKKRKKTNYIIIDTSNGLVKIPISIDLIDKHGNLIYNSVGKCYIVNSKQIYDSYLLPLNHIIDLKGIFIEEQNPRWVKIDIQNNKTGLPEYKIIRRVGVIL